PDVLFYPDMSSFRDLKNASGSDSKIVRDFASSDICVSLGPSHTSFYALTSLGKGISLTFHLLAQALTVARTVIGRPASQVLPDMIIILQIEPLIRYAISSLAPLRTLPPPLVSSFAIVNYICM